MLAVNVALNEGANLNVRSRPELSANIVTTLAAGAQVTATARTANLNWVQVQTANTTGWVTAAFIRPLEGGDLKALPVVQP